MAMAIPYELILNIMISQFFLYAANNIIEILKDLIVRVLAVIYGVYNTGNIFWASFRTYIQPLVLCLLFLISGVLLTLLVSSLKNP